MRIWKKKPRHTCPRRAENYARLTELGADRYITGHGLVGQKRGCSYCGSMHPDDFMAAVRAGLQIGPTDKSYKLYVDGYAGKFYTQHLDTAQSAELLELIQARKVQWGFPGYSYAGLYLPHLQPGAAR